ncbi:MAG: gephyrin-like molybdotransferase Glp [bacterium]
MPNKNDDIIKILEPIEPVLKSFLSEIKRDNTDFELIKTENALDRILFTEIKALQDLPLFDRALIDGYAVNSLSVSMADENTPIELEIIDDIDIGDEHVIKLCSNQAVKISTGAMIPQNADIVIPPDFTYTEKNKVKIYKSYVSGENIAKRGDDIAEGEVFIAKNRKIRPQDIGGILGIGIKEIKVYKKPIVSIIPTGNELISITEEIRPGQVHETNSFVLKGLIEQLGGIAKICPIIKDNPKLIEEGILNIIKTSDMIIISGGSSVGTKDCTVKAISNIKNSKITAHGIAIRPGKHTLLSFVEDKPVICLPGNPVACANSFLVFAKPALLDLAGIENSFWQDKKENIKISAFLLKDVESPIGREDYIRVRLRKGINGKITAYPFAGKFSFLSTLVKAHGVIKIPYDCTKLYEGDMVEVTLF